MGTSIFLGDNIDQRSIVELLVKIGYIYISPEECLRERRNLSRVLLYDVLRNQLKQINKFVYGDQYLEFSDSNIERAINDLDKPLLYDNLIKTNENIYNSLLFGGSYPEILNNGRIRNFTLKYIDWENIENNVFHVTNSYYVENSDKSYNSHLDVVVFVNGIPFAIIECKRFAMSFDEVIDRILKHQRDDHIPELFKFSQILIVVNEKEIKYGTTGTPKHFWGIWKEECSKFNNLMFLGKDFLDREITIQDKNIISLLFKERLLEITRHFILFDGNWKKICRYHQYFAVKCSIKTIKENDSNGNRKGGVIWHTQGSGKSLTMVMLAKYILVEFSQFDPKVVIVTDRKEFDAQIKATFAKIRMNSDRATSGVNLAELIKNGRANVITSIIHKFNKVKSTGISVDSKNIFVLIDVSHKYSYEEMSIKMKRVFPNACYIWFTGTPIMKNEKNKLRELGDFIHKYTVNDGINDKTIVPIVYESRFIFSNLDKWFEEITKRLTKKEQDDLKSKWNIISKINSTNTRINKIAIDINNHFIQYFKSTPFKAIFATNYKRDALRYLEVFNAIGNLKCEVLISTPDMRYGIDSIDDSWDYKVKDFWSNLMKKYRNEDNYEAIIKRRFIEGRIDILIVCSSILISFDAPSCKVLYIDKELKDHGLLQVMARTNLIKEGKDYGLIVDYRGLLGKFDYSMNTYSGAGFDKFDVEDIKGTVMDVSYIVRSIREKFSDISSFFRTVEEKTNIEKFEEFLRDDIRRHEFRKLLCTFKKYLSIIMGSTGAYNEFTQDEIKKYINTFKFLKVLWRNVKLRYTSFISQKEHVNLNVVDLKEGNPSIDSFDIERSEKEIDGAPKSLEIITYPENIKSQRDAQAFYGVIKEGLKDITEDIDFIGEISLSITEIIKQHNKVDWTNNLSIHDKIWRSISDLFFEYERSRDFRVSFDVLDRIIEDVKKVALRRF